MTQHTTPETYLYLHGFASSPQSIKAKALRDRFQRSGLTLHCLDLNQGDFATLTLTRQIQQAKAFLTAQPPIPVTAIGSSFGGLTAAWLGETVPSIQRLVLLAPAFEFLSHWLPRLGAETVAKWQAQETLPVYHYGEQRTRPLQYHFVTDLEHYSDSQLQRAVPTLIIHGVHDDTIPIQASRRFAEQRPWVDLQELDSDHALTDSQDTIWSFIRDYCHLNDVA